MAVDPINDDVFVSTPGSGSVEVFDTSGTLLDTVTGLGVNGENSIIYGDSEIFVADSVDGNIDEIDPLTYQLSTLSSGLIDPDYLAFAGGYLWTTTAVGYPGPTLVQIDITSGQTTESSVQLEGAGLFSNPSLPNTVFSYNAGEGLLAISEISVVGTPTVLVSHIEDGLKGTGDVPGTSELSMTPDGSSLIPASPSPQFESLSTSTLLETEPSYGAPSGSIPTAVAMTSGNGGLIAGGMNGVYNLDLLVWVLGSPHHALLTYEWPATGDQCGIDGPCYDETAPNGLAFSADGNYLFAVSGPSGEDATPEFHVFDLNGINGPPPALPESFWAFSLPLSALSIFALAWRNESRRKMQKPIREARKLRVA